MIEVSEVDEEYTVWGRVDAEGDDVVEELLVDEMCFVKGLLVDGMCFVDETFFAEDIELFAAELDLLVELVDVWTTQSQTPLISETS